MTNLIGLYSPAMGMGKSTLTDVLINEHGWVHVNFAGTLKKMVAVLLEDYGIKDTHKYLYGSMKETPLAGLGTTRALMQTLGTDWGRKMVNPTIWIDLAKAKIQRHLNDGWRVVVDDMRFPNEYQAIKELDGKTVKVVRPGLQDTTGHVSEGALEGQHFDYELRNEHGLAEWQGLASHFHETLAKS